VAREATLDQVHEQERKVVPDIDARELVIELDGIKQGGLPIQNHDVA
jgi:hypothetical protein